MKAMGNPEEVGAAGVSYLRVIGHLVFAYFWAQDGAGRAGALAQSDADPFYRAKLATARFYFQRLLPETAYHIRAARSGAEKPDGARGRAVLISAHERPADRLGDTSMKTFAVRKVAVLGAGVMGAQIAAHCINARVPVLLFDLADAKSPGQERHRAAGPSTTWRWLNPAPLALEGRCAIPRAGQLRPAPDAAGRVRPGDRGDRRAHGLEARSVPQGRAAHRAGRHLGVEHLRAVDRAACRRRSRRRCGRVFAACTSSIRRATCTWSS